MLHIQSLKRIKIKLYLNECSAENILFFQNGTKRTESDTKTLLMCNAQRFHIISYKRKIIA